MLDQLVESKDSNEGSFRNLLLLGTMFVVCLAFVTGLGYSLFAQQFIVGGDGLELSTLVAPPIPDEAPPPPEPDKDEPKKSSSDDEPKIATRTEAIARLDMSPKIPDKTSVQKFTGRAIPNAPFKLGDKNEEGTATGPAGPVRGGNTGGDFTPPARTEAPDPPKPSTDAPPPPPPPPPPPKVPSRISKGVVNGSAISLPPPPYPAAARAVNAKGAVNVAIVISKDGSVISASAVSGHPLLRQAAATAARRAKFRPTLLSGQPVEVSGVIVYNFQ